MKKAINNTTVEVTFDEEITDVKALDFAIEGLEITNAAVKQTNKKVVVLTTAAQTADTEYTVTLDGEKIGSFKGVSAVIPSKVDIVEKSVQGKLGQQVTVKAQVTVADGASKAGIPVTLFVPGSADGIKAPVTVEAITDENGVATHTYTRYAATTDNVTVYATGDRSKFSTGYVFWGVDTILKIEEVTTGATINNGANKTYKVTFKNDETGKPEANKVLNVSFLENINVTADKLQNAKVNGVDVLQLSNNTNTLAAQITTDSKGEATFTVSGLNAEVTPVVFEANNTVVNGTLQQDYKYEASDLQATTAKVKFAAIQAEYTIEIVRDGNDVAATGAANGRKYKVVVKDKSGAVAKNETVNVAFNEHLDRVISTNTEARFIKVNADGSQQYYTNVADANGNTENSISVKTNSKGEASFVIGSSKENDYATPVAWIDVNSSDAKRGQLDNGEPTTVAPISHFQAEFLDGAKLESYNGSEKDTTFEGSEVATFKTELTNQSGKKFNSPDAKTKSVTYTVFNTGNNDIKVTKQDGNTEVVSPNRSYTTTFTNTLTNTNTSLLVNSVDGKTTAVRVVATGVAEYKGKDFAFTAKEATATFTDSKEITNPYTGVLNLASIDKKEKEIKFVGKDKAVAYAGEDGKTYKYFGIGNTTIANADAFIALLEEYEAAGKSIRATYEVKDDVVTFTIISETAGTGTIGSAVDKVNAASNADQVRAAIKDLPEFVALSDASKTNAVNAILLALQSGTVFTPASLLAAINVEVTATSVYTAGTAEVIATKAKGVYANTAKTLTIETTAAGTTAYNGVKVVFAANTEVNNSVDTDYDVASKTLTVKLPVSAIDPVTQVATLANVNFDDVTGAIESALPVATSLVGFTGTDSAVELNKKVIELTGAKEAAPAENAKVELTFSEAVNVTAGTVELTVTKANGTVATVTSDAHVGATNTKTVTLTFSADPTLTAADTITAIKATNIVIPTGKTLVTPVKITVAP